jgi:hypothetical protein
MSTNKSGIKLLPFHPLVDLFPPLPDQEFDDLVADIEKHGQRNEIDTWNGQMIDGKHRALACQKLGIEPRYHARRFESEIGARDFVVSQNFHRRHLTPEHKHALIEALADWSKSDRAIAGQLKTSKDTIRRVRKAVEKKKPSTGAGAPVEKKRTGKDGKARKQPARKAVKVEPEVEPTPLVGKCSYCKKREGQLIADLSGRGLPDRYICDECDEPKAKAAEPERNGEEGDPNYAGPDSHLNNDGTLAIVNNTKPTSMRMAGFFFRASEAERGARMDDMAGLPVDEDMCKVAQAAAAAWIELARILTARSAKAAPAVAAADAA